MLIIITIIITTIITTITIYSRPQKNGHDEPSAGTGFAGSGSWIGIPFWGPRINRIDRIE